MPTTTTHTPAVLQEISRLARDRDTSPAVRRLIAQAPAMVSLCRDIVLTWDDETPRAVVSKARAILRAVDG
jgi:hypothetical protein